MAREGAKIEVRIARETQHLMEEKFKEKERFMRSAKLIVKLGTGKIPE